MYITMCVCIYTYTYIYIHLYSYTHISGLIYFEISSIPLFPYISQTCISEVQVILSHHNAFFMVSICFNIDLITEFNVQPICRSLQSMVIPRYSLWILCFPDEVRQRCLTAFVCWCMSAHVMFLYS
jgi:hypothetical protein